MNSRVYAGAAVRSGGRGIVRWRPAPLADQATDLFVPVILERSVPPGTVPIPGCCLDLTTLEGALLTGPGTITEVAGERGELFRRSG